MSSAPLAAATQQARTIFAAVSTASPSLDHMPQYGDGPEICVPRARDGRGSMLADAARRAFEQRHSATTRNSRPRPLRAGRSVQGGENATLVRSRDGQMSAPMARSSRPRTLAGFVVIEARDMTKRCASLRHSLPNSALSNATGHDLRLMLDSTSSTA